MALQHLRANTANKRPTPAAMADGQLAVNTAAVSPGLFFKDAGGALVKVGPIHVGTTAPNATPASGGEAGNSVGEQWLDTAGGRFVFKVWDGTAWRTEDGEFVNASGDTMTGALVMDNQQQIRFRETTANGTNFIALQAPASVASDKTITLPDVTGTVITSGDSGTVTSTMIADGTIVNADINASAAIVDTKLATIATAGKVSNSATTAASANTASAIVARDASGNFSAGTITADLTGTASAIADNIVTSAKIVDGTIVNADINATAEIAVSKLADGAARQLLQTDAAGTGVEWTDNVDVPGTLDVTGAAVFDSTVAVTGALTKGGSNVVTVGDTGTVSTAMVVNDAVTYAKLQNVSATDRLLGRSAAGAGDVEEITCTAAGRALLDDADAAAQRTTLGLGTLATQSGTFSGTSSGTNTGDQTITLTGDVTGSGTGSFATEIAAGVIDNADINASAAIAGTKISPNFGSQTVQTTGIFSHALGTATAPTVTFTGDLNTGIYSPGADQVAISTNGTERIRITSNGDLDFRQGYSSGQGSKNILLGGKAQGGAIETNQIRLASYGDLYYQYIQGSANYGVSTSGVLSFGNNTGEKMRLDSSGRLGLGTSSPSTRFHAAASISTLPSPEDYTTTVGYFNNTYLNTTNGTSSYTVLRLRREGEGGVSYASTADFGIARYEASSTNSRTRLDIKLGHAGTNTTDTTVMSLLSSGAVGIGTTPSEKLHVSGGNVYVQTSAGNPCSIDLAANGASPQSSSLTIAQESTGVAAIFNRANAAMYFATNGTERARITSDGKLLVGTSTARANFFNATTTAGLQLEAANNAAAANRYASITYGDNEANAPIFILAKHRGTTLGSTTVVNSGDQLGRISFQGADGTEFVPAVDISAAVDGTPGANDMPGRLVFSTTADGASSPTEHMRITSSGIVSSKGSSANNFGTAGYDLFSGGAVNVTADAGASLYLNRLTDDGDLVQFYQASTLEGSISVSGTTVSYNGAHLSRWSQLPGGAERAEILRGTVLSNIDEMCDWGEETNEQLNRMKVSDVEGDKNVSGVFQAWDDDDDTYTDDFYCAMTGDFIIRIAEGVTVQRGDLLMSAGDGTAKPQDDDIIRSKTIAKVTSSHVTCTYDDGSYCVPCVLMAC